MDIFNGVISSNNLGIYQNNLVAANQDYLKVDNISQSFVNRSDIDVEINCNVNGGANECLFCYGDFNQPDTGFFWIVSATTGGGEFQIYVSDYNNTNVLNVSFGSVPSGEFNLKVKNLEILLNDVVIYTMADSTVNLNSNTELYLGLRVSFWYLNGYIKNFRSGTETFSLNEANGATFYGSNGTTGTRFTSHADGLTYLNNEMIERYG